MKKGLRTTRAWLVGVRLAVPSWFGHARYEKKGYGKPYPYKLIVGKVDIEELIHEAV